MRSQRTKVIEAKASEILILESEERDLQKLRELSDRFSSQASALYQRLLELEAKGEGFEHLSQFAPDSYSTLRAINWEAAQDWSPSIYFQIRKALTELVRNMVRTERATRASVIRDGRILTKKLRSQLTNVSSALDIETMTLSGLQADKTALLDHLSVLRSSNLIKRQLLKVEHRGKQLSNRTSEIEDRLRELEGEIKEAERNLSHQKSICERMQKEQADLASDIWHASKNPLLTEPLSQGLTELSDFLKLIPVRCRKVQKPLSFVISEEADRIRARKLFLESPDSDEEVTSQLQRKSEREKRAANKAKSIAEERARDAKRKELAAFQRAERHIEANQGLMKELFRNEKLLDSFEQRLTRAQSQLERIETQMKLMLEKLWLRDAGKTLRTSRGREEVRDPTFFQKNLVLYPALARKLEQKSDLERDISRLQKECTSIRNVVKPLREKAKKFKQAEVLVSKGAPSSFSRKGRPKKVVTEWIHAEELARDFMVYLGFGDARLTKQGADGGVDVSSRRAVAQVKMHSKGVASYDVQKLVGIAAVEGKTPLFFAMSYSRDAKSWSNKYGIALFCFDRSGEVVAISEKARSLELDTQ